MRSGAGIKPLFKMHPNLSLPRAVESHGLIYLMQYVSLKYDTFSFLSELF